MSFVSALLAIAQIAMANGPVLVLDEPVVRVRDIAAVPTGGEAVILRLPRGRNAVELDEAARRRLVRNRLPGVEFDLRHRGALTLSRPGRSAAARSCTVTRHDIAAGSYLLRSDVTREPCASASSRPALAYDRATGAVRARADIPAGTDIGAVPLPETPPLPAGQDAVIAFAGGPVVIQREVRTLQPARPGRSVFVRTNDGEVFAATIEDSSETDR